MWLLNNNIHTFQNQFDCLIVFFIKFTLLFPRLSFSSYSFLFRNGSIFLFWLFFLVLGLLMQQFVEKLEINSQYGGSGFHISRSNHDWSGFIQESESINPMWRFDALPTQEKTDFLQYNLLNVILECRSKHNCFDKDVYCVTLNFLNLVAKFVNHDVQHRLS